LSTRESRSTQPWTLRTHVLLAEGKTGQETLQRLREVDDHREGNNQLGHESSFTPTTFSLTIL
jgi:hypothetical protein